MKIVNKTPYQTRHLRAFALRAAREELEPEHLHLITVTFKPLSGKRHAGSPWSGGSAELGYKVWATYALNRQGFIDGTTTRHIGRRVTINVPVRDPNGVLGDWKPEQFTILRQSLAHVLLHEFAHCHGKTHNDMRGASRYRYVGNWRDHVAWALELPLERKPEKPKPTVDDKRILRLRRAAWNLALWETKLKRAQTKVKRWRATVRRMERYNAAAMAARKEQGDA